MFDDREKRNAHPGWAVQYEDGSWLGCAHGFFRAIDAFYGRLYDTKEAAERDAKDANEDWKDKGKYTIVPGWEILCEDLRHKVSTLKEANTVDPSTILDIVLELEGVISRLSPSWRNKEEEDKKT